MKFTSLFITFEMWEVHVTNEHEILSQVIVESVSNLYSCWNLLDKIIFHLN